jgi:hypothetical protein
MSNTSKDVLLALLFGSPLGFLLGVSFRVFGSSTGNILLLFGIVSVIGFLTGLLAHYRLNIALTNGPKGVIVAMAAAVATFALYAMLAHEIRLSEVVVVILSTLVGIVSEDLALRAKAYLWELKFKMAIRSKRV